VTACIALASTGGVEGSFFTAQRCSPWLSRNSHGDSNLTGGGVADAVQRNAAMTNVAICLIAPVVVSFFGCRVESKRGRMRRVKYSDG
jgi:hypothetical protein